MEDIMPEVDPEAVPASVKPRTVKVTVNLPVDVVQALKDMADRSSTTMTDQIRRAISTEKWIQDMRGAHRFLLDDNSGHVREIVFK
jgi:predicted transcriptional regulator